MGPAWPSLPTISPVQGVILEETRLYVVQEFGEPTWTQVLERSGRPAYHLYELDHAYPDQGFGEAMVPDMFKYYSILVNPRWSFVDFLLGMEPVLHAALHLHTPGALPTKVQATRTGPDTVKVVYDSPLRACSAVRGVIRGAAAHYGVEIAITENYCVLRGDAAYVFTVEGSKD